MFCYWNLHKRTWSVKALSGYAKGKVIAHSDTVALAYPYAKVSEAGRQRVIREKRKNVHAGIVGLFELDRLQDDVLHVEACGEGEQITYNPYKGPHFTYKASGERFSDAMTSALTVGLRGQPVVTVYHLY